MDGEHFSYWALTPRAILTVLEILKIRSWDLNKWSNNSVFFITVNAYYGVNALWYENVNNAHKIEYDVESEARKPHAQLNYNNNNTQLVTRHKSILSIYSIVNASCNHVCSCTFSFLPALVSILNKIHVSMNNWINRLLTQLYFIGIACPPG